jgi:hypothetical protein
MTAGWKILAVLLLVAAAIWGWDHYTDGLIADGDKAGYARAVREYKDAELKAIQAVRKEEGRRIAALQGVIDESKKDLEGARAAAAAASDAGGRLRNELAAIRRRGLGTNPAAARGGSPADAAGDLLERVQRGLDGAAESIARHADESRVAGKACERAYDALTPK